jgi:hypothetical protein
MDIADTGHECILHGGMSLWEVQTKIEIHLARLAFELPNLYTIKVS